MEKAGEATLEVAKEETPKTEGSKEESQAAIILVKLSVGLSTARRNHHEFELRVVLDYRSMGHDCIPMDSENRGWGDTHLLKDLAYRNRVF
ncbi:MAG: hypothetical protein ACJZ42_05215 [Candidatus Thalassarchaeaceae archaeon]